MFLESQFVPEAGLLRAAKAAGPDSATIWVASDNLLASRALEALGSRLGRVVESTLDSRYGGGFDGLHEVLLGLDIPDDIRAPVYFVVGTVYSRELGSAFRVMWEVRAGPVMRDWSEYADLVVYRALDRLLEGDLRGAEVLFLTLASMWDGSGFRDKAFDGSYDTYKLALAIYLYRALEAGGSKVVYLHEDIVGGACVILTRLQRGDGGVVTDYIVRDGYVVPIGDANVETTSMVALALYSDYPEKIGGGFTPPLEKGDWGGGLGVHHISGIPVSLMKLKK